ncbi:MAG: phosphoribosylanthranilate isomerase [Thermoleophilia bacterium]
MADIKVKICGLTRAEDAALAVELGAWALGVIFAPESPRQVTAEEAAVVLSAAPAGVERVGVFVNAGAGEIEAAVRACGLTAVQLHGEEDEDLAREVRERTGAVVIRSVKVPARAGERSVAAPSGAGPGASGNEALAGVVQFDTDFILLDTYHPERRGGTGEVFDWGLAEAIPEAVRRRRLILSGGLKPENIIAAVRLLTPFAVDVSSGVESAPGVKDPVPLRQLFENLEIFRKETG